MARPDETSIRFPCPHCFARLRASPAQAGTQRRCPMCQWVSEVPTQSRALKPQEGYAEGYRRFHERLDAFAKTVFRYGVINDLEND